MHSALLAPGEARRITHCAPLADTDLIPCQE